MISVPRTLSLWLRSTRSRQIDRSVVWSTLSCAQCYTIQHNSSSLLSCTRNNPLFFFIFFFQTFISEANSVTSALLKAHLTRALQKAADTFEASDGEEEVEEEEVLFS